MSGLVERFDRTMKDMPACCVRADQCDCDGWLQHVVYAYHTSVRTSNEMQPHFLVYGAQDIHLATSCSTLKTSP